MSLCTSKQCFQRHTFARIGVRREENARGGRLFREVHVWRWEGVRRRSKAGPSGARRCKAYQIWKLLNRKKFERVLQLISHNFINQIKGLMDRFVTLEARQRIAAYGVGFKLLSMHELRTWILKEEVGYINTMMEEHKKAWAEYGCTIMSDGWTDDDFVKEVGEEHVIQVITDNASNYKMLE
ncbi:unnamed protein product [Prunus armeniaca]